MITLELIVIQPCQLSETFINSLEWPEPLKILKSAPNTPFHLQNEHSAQTHCPISTKESKS